MKESDIVSTLTVRFVSDGEGAVVAASNAVSAAQEKLLARLNALASASESSATRQASAAAAVEALARKADPAVRALAELEQVQVKLSRALGQGVVSVQRANEILDVYAQKANAAVVASENLRRQQSNISTNTTVAAPTNPTQITGAQLSNVNTKEYAAQFEAAAKAQDDMVAAANRLKAALNPLAGEEAKQAAELALLKEAQQAEIITAEQFAAAQQMSVTRLANLSQSLKTAGTAGRVMSGEMTNLGFQLNDVVTGLALGQSPFMILAQQGGQVVQIFANSKSSIADFASSAIGWFNSLFTVGRVAFGGIAAVVGAAAYAMNSFATSQREAGQALIGIGQRTGTTISQINDFAKANATITGLSVDQARAVAIEFTKTGNIAVSGLKGVGDAVHGFSILTGQDATEATKTLAKAFSGDLVQGAQEINKTYGFLNSSTMEYIRTLVLQGDRSAAMQVILDAMAKDNLKAADSVGVLSKAWDAVANAMSRVKNAVGAVGAPASLQDQIASVQARRDAIVSSPSPLGGNPGGYGMLNTGTLADGGAAAKAAALKEVDRILDDLNKKLKEFNADAVVKNLDRMSVAGDAVVKSIIPQIDQINALELKLKELQDAQNTPGVKRNLGQDDAATVAIQNQLAALRESQAESERYNQNVQQISQSWGNVSQSTALSLQSLQNQLPVAEAITEAAKMEAQYTATVNELRQKGKTIEDATALASKQYEVSKASAVASAAKLVQSSQDQLDLLKASGTEDEARLKASIAYRDAIQAGATSLQASVISANTLAAELFRAADAANKMAQAEASAAQAAALAADPTRANAGGYSSSSNVVTGKQYTSTSNLGLAYLSAYNMTPSTQQLISSAIAGGVDSAIAKLKTTSVSSGFGLTDFSSVGLPSKGSQSDITSAIMSLYDLKNTQLGSNTAGRLANYQDEIAFLQKQPATIENMRAIADLTQTMNSLANSTDSLNSTMKDALSPYYTQDPRTSHIGFRSQGMATGGEFTVPGGYSSNDNMLGSIPLASGEVVSVHRPGEGGSGTTQIIHINSPITINGNADKDRVGRTVFQMLQRNGKQLRASSQ